MITEAVQFKPSTFYYRDWRDSSFCSVGMTVSNMSATEQRLEFSQSFLVAETDTILMRSIYHATGIPFAPSKSLLLSPNTDTAIALHYVGKRTTFKDTLRFRLQSLNVDTVLTYQRVR